MNPKILDPCCGSRMFWNNRQCPGVVFGDNRELEDTLCDGRKLEIKPDIKMDFRKMPFSNNSFKLIVFDPPHMKSLGKNSWMAKKYGVLGETWRDDLRKGFSECFRVLEDGDILIFKWNETDIKVKEVLELVDYEYLLGHPSGKRMNTHWFTFMKSSLYLKTKNNNQQCLNGEKPIEGRDESQLYPTRTTETPNKDSVDNSRTTPADTYNLNNTENKNE